MVPTISQGNSTVNSHFDFFPKVYTEHKVLNQREEMFPLVYVSTKQLSTLSFSLYLLPNRETAPPQAGPPCPLHVSLENLFCFGNLLFCGRRFVCLVRWNFVWRKLQVEGIISALEIMTTKVFSFLFLGKAAGREICCSTNLHYLMINIGNLLGDQYGIEDHTKDFSLFAVEVPGVIRLFILW